MTRAGEDGSAWRANLMPPDTGKMPDAPRRRWQTRGRRLAEELSRYPVIGWLGSGVKWLGELGTAPYPPDIRRRLLIVNLIAYLIAVTTAGYALQHVQLDYQTYKPIVFINLALLAMALTVPAMHRFSSIAGGMLIVVSEYVALMAFTMYLGRSSGIHLQYIVAAAAPFVVFGLERLKLVTVVVILGLVLHIVAWFQFPPEKALIPADQELLDSLYTQAAITTVGLIAASIWYAFRLVERARAETDALLRNILPDSVADRLKSRPGELIADTHDEVSVLFADISGFVGLARSLGASKVVHLLNEIVSEFDKLAAKHGVEKIKTIGDAYMAVAGLPDPTHDHAERLARMALDMLAVVERFRAETGLSLQMRIGMAAGPVLAGVIGTRKFSYDVWGDAVNLAARLENLGEPGRIHLCPICRERLVHAFEIESRGLTEIRGVGQQETWFLVGIRRCDSASAGQA
ncbi:MAG TPA: adenylate/guanylate cyclase domain-containing protein [Hyphomicrobiaceae bacterium]